MRRGPKHRAPTRLRIATLAIALLVCPALAIAQGGFGHLEDASIAPRGVVRLRTSTVWTRYEQRYASGGLAALGAPFTADSLGPSQIPELAIVDSLVDDAAASPFTLSLGKSRLSSMAREEFMPITLEYGVTRRLAFGLVVPLVRKRVAGLFTIDSAGANMGPNPRRRSATALATNANVQAQFLAARTQLETQLQNCIANPGAAGCPALLARQAEAQALIQSSQSFASSVAALYGTTTTEGEAFVPRTQSGAQAAIAARVAAFNLQYQDILASSASFVTAIPVGSAGPAGSADVVDYVIRDLGRDSIAAKTQVGVGDMELGVKFLAADYSGFKLAVASSLRLPTATRKAPAGVADLRIGDGGIGFDARAILEAHRGRLAVLGAASYTKLGSTAETAAGDSRRITIDVAPRWHLSAPLAIHGAWSLRDADVTGSTQLMGGGVSFTTVNSTWSPGTRPLPMEMRFTHLETVSAAVGAPKATRDQLEVRIYYQRRGR
jgi:hypothetical protein